MRRFIPDAGAWLKGMRKQGSGYMAAMVPVMFLSGIMFSQTDKVRASERGAVEAEAEQATVARSGASTVAENALERDANPEIARYARKYGISRGLARQIYRAALNHRIQPSVAFGLVKTESSFRRSVVSYAGAVGYTQLLPSTARWIAPGTSRPQLFNTRTNLQVGFKYLRYLLNKYDQNTRLALLAYNRGPGTVDRLLARGANPANGYARKVLSG